MDTANSKESVDVSHLKPYQWKPGQSGNPSGRPKNSLKDYVRQKFMSMTDEEKEAFLKLIAPDEQWRMGEGNPHQDNTSKVDANVVVEITNYAGTPAPELPAKELPN